MSFFPTSLFFPEACKHATASLILLLLFIPTFSHANEEKAVSVPSGQFDTLKHTKSGRVDKVIDGLTILLKDKTIIRLASLDIPDFNDRQNAPIAEEAQNHLNTLLPEGTEIMIYQTRMAKKGRVNRMNHQLVHIVTKKEPQWINGFLLAHGLTRVYTTPNAPEMSAQMLNIENEARKAKRGLWAEGSVYQVLTPETASQAMGKLAVIEGVVAKTASVRNNIYLNFGQNWKTDFTIMIPSALRKKLAQNGIDPLGLAHQKIRVRGYLREYNGPLIELEAIEHLEVM